MAAESVHRRVIGRRAAVAHPSAAARRLSVLTAPAPGLPHDNPYISNLNSALREQVDLLDFRFSRALLGRFDVVHIHWPEYLLRSGSRSRRLLRQILFALFIVRIRVRRTAAVATIHNERPHEDGGFLERTLIRMWMNSVTTRIYLTRAAADAWSTRSGSARRGRAVVIEHGHYGEDLIRLGMTDRTPHDGPIRLLTFGVIRRYKGIDGLLISMEAARSEGLDATLRIVGNPLDADVAATIEETTRQSPWLTSRLEFVSEDDLVQEILMSDGVVLPYEYMYNSGAMLLALTLRRAVLVPDGPTGAETAAEVGDGWVARFRPPLREDDLRTFASGLRGRSGAGPDLSERAWDRIGRRHADAFHAATRARTGSRRG